MNNYFLDILKWEVNIKINFPIIIISLLSISFGMIAFYNFLFIGPFKWHIMQPEVIEGAIELFAVFLLIYFSIKSINKFKVLSISIILLISFLYFRRHNVDISILLVICYVNVLYFLGSIIISKLNISYKSMLILLIGICICIIYSSLLSLFNLATMHNLVYSIGIIFIFSLFYKNHNLIYIVFNFSKKQVSTGIETPFIISIFFIYFFILFVKSSQTPSYDELWYSLRGYEVLNHNGSFFEPILMMQHWVSFYPKLYEIILYPFEYFETFTTSRLFTVFLLIFMTVSFYEFLKERVGYKESLFIILSILTIPAVGNSSILAKPDIISSFIVIASILYFIKYTETNFLTYLILSIVLMLFSLSTKLSVIPFIGILSLIYFSYFIFNFKRLNYNFSKRYMIIVFLLFIVLIIITFRTIHIVGVPFVSLKETIPIISKLYDFLGFNYNSLFQDITINQFSDNYNFLNFFIKFNFFPAETRLIFAWVSNLSSLLFLIFICILLKNRFNLNIRRIIALMLFSTFLYLICIVFGNKHYLGGDGNYYLIPIIAFMLLISIEKDIIRFQKLFIPIIIINFIIMFITSHSWSYGTNKFDFNFSKNPFNKEEIRLNSLKYNNVDDIYYILKNTPNNKVIGYGKEEMLFLLNASYESIPHIQSQRPYLFLNFETFNNYLLKSEITHIVFPKDFPLDSRFRNFIESLKESRNIKEYQGNSFILLDIRNLKG